MKTKLFLSMAAVVLLASCGSQKRVMNSDYYNHPQQQADVQPRLQKRLTREVDKLVTEETNSMRAVGIGNDYDEKQARREAINDAKNTLAGYIETAVVALTQEYNKKSSMNVKKMSESQIEGFVETTVSQKISTKMIGTPEIYDASDGSVQVYVCLELTKPTKEVLGDVYDNLTQEQILGIDYDKQKFINDNIDRIQRLREQAK